MPAPLFFVAPAVLGNHLSQKAGPQSKNFAADPSQRGSRAAASGRGVLTDSGRYFFFATTLVTRLPMAGDFISTVSPGFRKRSGAEVLSGRSALESAAVPAAVPPLMISPGKSVKSRDRYWRYSPKVSTMSLVLYFWRRSPLTDNSMSVFDGST